MNTESGKPWFEDQKRSGNLPTATDSALHFPKNFLWGTATSATQVEGHITNEWTDFVAPDGNHCRVACDQVLRPPNLERASESEFVRETAREGGTCTHTHTHTQL